MEKINAFEIHERLVKLGEDWAHKKYAEDLLESARKPLLAKLGTQCNEKSQNAREAYALAHDDYKEHCEELAKAAEQTAIAKIRYESALNYIELIRTQSANERAAMREAT
jgi:hypothetical protein